MVRILDHIRSRTRFGSRSRDSNAPVPQASADRYDRLDQGYMPGYASSTAGPRNGFWGLGQGASNTALGYNLSAMRSRSRFLTRNVPYARQGLEKLVGYYIGRGVTVRFKTGKAKLDKDLTALFAKWAEQCDARGRTNLNGLLRQLAYESLEAGEGFLRFRNRRPEDGLVVPLQVEGLQADFCAERWMDGQPAGAPAGSVVVQGIELSPLGEVAAYYLYPHNPRDAAGQYFQNWNISPLRYAASEVLQLADGRDFSALHGEPVLAVIASQLYEFGDYLGAESVRMRNNAAYTAVIKPASVTGQSFINDNAVPIGEDAADPLAQASGDYAVGESAISPGETVTLAPGDEFELLKGPEVGQTFSPWVNAVLRMCAAGLGVPFETLTGDFSGLNDRTWRAVTLELQSKVDHWRDHVLKPQVLRPLVQRWLTTVFLAESIKLPVGLTPDMITFDLVLPPMNFIDQFRQVQTYILARRSGLLTRADAISLLTGRDVHEVEAEIAAEDKRADAAGFIFDSDARRTTDAGQSQVKVTDKVSTTTLPEPTPSDDET